MMKLNRSCCLVSALAIAISGIALGQNVAATTDAPQVGVMDGPVDASIESFRLELLEMGFDAASQLPVQPHIKDRARMQALVVDTCFDLELPQRAIRYGERIDNWRKGAAFADYAHYLVQHGYTGGVQDYLDRATAVAAENEDWRRDTIKTKVANVYLWLGQKKQVEKFEENLVQSEKGKVDITRAQLSSAESFDDQVARLDELIATGVFESVSNAHDAYAELFDRFYEDAEKRSLAETKIKNSSTHIPVAVRVETTMKLAGHALSHNDTAKALELLNEAQSVISSVPWTPEAEIALRARLAALRYQAGEKDTATSDIKSALEFYQAKRELIVTVYRGTALRSIAEAQLQMDDRTGALATYNKAMEEGSSNPNGRPRVMDLCETCCSLAKNDCEPDAALWTKLRATHEGLSQPW